MSTIEIDENGSCTVNGKSNGSAITNYGSVSYVLNDFNLVVIKVNEIIRNGINEIDAPALRSFQVLLVSS